MCSFRYSEVLLDDIIPVQMHINIENCGKSSCYWKSFYPTALKGCQGIVFTHGRWAGSGKKFVRAVSQKL